MYEEARAYTYEASFNPWRAIHVSSAGPWHRSGEKVTSGDLPLIGLSRSSSPSFLHISSMNAKALTRSFSGRTLNALTASASQPHTMEDVRAWS